MTKYYNKSTGLIGKASCQFDWTPLIRSCTYQKSAVDDSSKAYYHSVELPGVPLPYMVDKNATTYLVLQDTGKIGAYGAPVLSQVLPPRPSSLQVVDKRISANNVKNDSKWVINFSGTYPLIRPSPSWDAGGVGVGVMPVLSTLEFSGQAYNVAVTAMQSRIREKAQTFVSIAEFGKTCKMVAEAATTIYTAFGLVKRGKFKLAAKHLGLTSVPKNLRNRSRAKKRSLIDNWMEYRFGWRPLYYDVYDHLVTFYERFRTPFFFDVYGFGFDTIVNGAPFDYPVQGLSFNSAGKPRVYNSWSARQDFNMRYTHTRRKIKVGCVFEVKGLGTEHSLSDFGILDPLSVLYELTPLSWMADWWWRVGDWLKQATIYNTVHFVGGYEQMTNDKFYSFTPILLEPNPSANIQFTTLDPGDSFNQVLRTLTRRRLGSLPYAGIIGNSTEEVFSNPDGDPYRALDAIGVLNSLLKGNHDLKHFRI